MMRKASLLALVAALLVVAAQAAASPLTVSLSGFPATFTKFYVYDGNGGLVASGDVSNGAFTFNYTGSAVAVKVVAGNATLVARVPSGLTSQQYSIAYRDVSTLTVKINFTGSSIFKPDSVMVTVTPEGLREVAAPSSTVIFVQPPVTVKLPDALYFPSLYGFKLVGVAIGGREQGNPFNVTSSGVDWEVVATYEPTGLAAIDPTILLVVVVLLIVAVLALAARRVRPAAVIAYRSPYLE